MFNPHTEFVCLRLPAMKKLKATQNVKILVLSFGKLKGSAQNLSLWLDGKRIVDFLLVIIELFRLLSKLRHY